MGLKPRYGSHAAHVARSRIAWSCAKGAKRLGSCGDPWPRSHLLPAFLRPLVRPMPPMFFPANRLPFAPQDGTGRQQASSYTRNLASGRVGAAGSVGTAHIPVVGEQCIATAVYEQTSNLLIANVFKVALPFNAL